LNQAPDNVSHPIRPKQKTPDRLFPIAHCTSFQRLYKTGICPALHAVLKGNFSAWRVVGREAGGNWFQQAWDEPFYLADILDSSFRLDSRSASHLLGKLLQALGVRDLAWVTLAYDLAFPIAVVGMAYLLSKHFATHVVSRLAIALVFSFELLSFSSYNFLLSAHGHTRQYYWR